MISTPNRGVDPLYTTVTPILYPNQPGHATGFFYSDIGDQDPESLNNADIDVFLITNHHVVADENGEPLSDSIRIITRPDQQRLDQLQYHDLQLVDDEGDPRWIEHPQGSSVDVVALPLNLDISGGGNRLVTNQLRLPDDVMVSFGQEAVVLGYPIRGSSPYLPIARNAMIASPYGVPFEEMPCFATDADMHSGTSGSPVFTRPSALQQTTEGFQLGGNQRMHFIGIHSATMQSDHDPEEGPLNINVSWYSELLDDLIP